MIQVEMGVQQVFHVQFVLYDEVFQGQLLFFVEAAGVNDDRFVGFVPEHVAVLGEHIEFESFNFHGSLYLIIMMIYRWMATYTTFLVLKNSSSK